jgi:hypothetical protein
VYLGLAENFSQRIHEGSWWVGIVKNQMSRVNVSAYVFYFFAQSGKKVAKKRF